MPKEIVSNKEWMRVLLGVIHKSLIGGKPRLVTLPQVSFTPLVVINLEMLSHADHKVGGEATIMFASFVEMFAKPTKFRVINQAEYMPVSFAVALLILGPHVSKTLYLQELEVMPFLSYNIT